MESRFEPHKMTHIGFKRIAEKEKKSWVRHQFDAVARRYDFMNTLLSFGIHFLWKRTAIRKLSLKPGNVVLDLCGGTGDLSVMATRMVGPAGRVVLYDINDEMIAAGRAASTYAALRKQIKYVQGDAERMAFPDNSFDAVVVGFGVRNLTDMEKGFSEMHRVLKPGGKMVCLEFSTPVHPFFKKLYDLYSFYLMPILGEWLTGSKDAYTYLPESIRLFPSPDQLVDKLKQIGFCQLNYKRLTNGIAAIHCGTKDASAGEYVRT